MSMHRSIRKRKASPTTRSTPTATAAAGDLRPTSWTTLGHTLAVGAHTVLLACSVLFLPRLARSVHGTSAAATAATTATKRTSLDRPQSPFLEALTASPPWTLACACVGAAVLQRCWARWLDGWAAAAAAAAVDATGEGAALGTAGAEHEHEHERAASEVERSHGAHRAGRDEPKAWLMTIVVSLIFHVVIIFFGAPITSHHRHTFLLALLLSVLIVFAPAYCLGVPSLRPDKQPPAHQLTWIRLFARHEARSPAERAMLYPAVGTALGCWAGAYPLALDWDRPWQAWPLAPMFGAVSGYIAGSIWALANGSHGRVAEERTSDVPDLDLSDTASYPSDPNPNPH